MDQSRLKLTLWIWTVATVLAGCVGGSGGGGGGGGMASSGGYAGTACATPQKQGCLPGNPPTIMVCGADGKWALQQACAVGQLCVENFSTGVAVPSCVNPGTAQDASSADASGDAIADVIAADNGVGDSAVTDGTPGSDAQLTDNGGGDAVKPGPVCGDGKCEGIETDLGCPADCAKKAVCGNNECETGELPTTCPTDCKPNCQPECAAKQCGADGCGGLCGKCGDGKACTDAGQCVQIGAICGNGKCENGENDSSCSADCVATGTVCGNGKCEIGENTSNCLKDCPAAGPVCGNGTCESGENTSNCLKDCPAAGPVCGNGTCESGESSSNCAKDCPATGPSCVGKCGGDAGTCYCDNFCTDNGDCCADYKVACGGGSCTPKCAAGAICGTSDGCGGLCAGSCAAGLVCNTSKVCVPNSAKCGNGVCETGESTTSCSADCKSAAGSCNGMCGKASGSCYCDSQCKSSGDCCTDYDKYCGSSTTPVCGNGKCESGETKTNCSKDCGSTSSACPNGPCEAGETEASCPQDCKLGCYGDFTLGSTFYKSQDTKQTGLACDNKSMPKNCPDGFWINFPDTGDCICILSCAGIGVTVGQNCTTDGAWKCMEILATNASANGGKMCVPTKWGLCTK